jgi:hypothetical protein
VGAKFCTSPSQTQKLYDAHSNENDDLSKQKCSSSVGTERRDELSESSPSHKRIKKPNSRLSQLLQ